MPIDHLNFRLRGIPCEYQSRADVRELVKKTLSIASGASFAVHSLAISPVEYSSKVATLSFRTLPDELSDNARNEWVFSLPVDDNLDCFTPRRFLVFDTHFSGFTPLQHAKDVDCHLDVIAISGLGGHAFGSFKEKQGPFMWLRDALPLDVPRARVLIYGYDTHLIRSSSFQNLTDLGRTLQIDMKGMQRSNQSRPIIFIGHSLGGLVIKEAIVKMTEAKDEEYASILNSVSGFLFLGVPHLGMAIESIVPLVRDSPNRSLLESLSKNSALLQRLENEFSNAFGTRRPCVTAFYETESSPTAEEKGDKWILSGPPKVLVDVSSAICGSKIQHPINRNHSDLVKFKHQYDELYLRVRTAMQPLVSRQGSLVVGAIDDEISVLAPLSEEHRDCLRSLAFREQESRYHGIHSAKNTCGWLFENSQFQAWLSQSRGLFWIKGNPGAGKSVLMKFAVTRMNCTTTGELVVFFFCHGRGTLLQKTPLGAFRALLNSMLAYFPEYLSRLTVKFKNQEARFGSYEMDRWDWTEEELQEAMSEVLIKGTKDRPVTIFVDALDECGEDYAKYLLEYFKLLMDDVEYDEGRVKICFSSRHYPILGFHTIPTISVEEENDKDIRSVIRERLKAITPEEKRRQIQNEILLKAQGGFQWVVLVIGMVMKASATGVKADILYRNLASTPEPLDELYTKILSDVTEAETKELVKLFQWILFSERPLSTQELREALATNKNMVCTTVSELRSQVCWADTLDEFESYVKHVSRGLVEFRTREVWEQYEPGGENWDREAQFVHQSVADYVLGKFLHRIVHYPHPTQSQIGTGHFEISRSCLKYMTLRDLLDDATQLCRGTLSARFPLAPYAVDFLFYHIRKVELEGIPQLDLLALIQWGKWLEALQEIACLWRVLDPHSAHTPMGWPFIKATPMHVIIAFGSRSAFDEYLQKDDVQVDGRDLNGNTPLLLAIRECHEDMAITLLNRSVRWQARYQEAIDHRITQTEDTEQKMSHFVDVNAENDDGDTPLTIALTGNAQKIIFKLIEAGVDLKCVGKGLALVFYAIHNRNKRLLVTLIEEQVKLDGAVYFALSELPFIERELVLEEMISELLKAGANTRKLLEFRKSKGPHWDEEDGYDDGVSCGDSDWEENEHDDEAILLASQKGQTAIAYLLLSHGASTTFKNKHGTCPLLAAVENGHGELARLLLRKDPSAVGLNDHDGRTALDAALANGDFELAILLLTDGSFSTSGIILADAFIRAITNGQWAIVKAILRKYNSTKLFVDNQGTTALLRALELDNEELALLLITEGHASNIGGNGANFDSRDNDTRSPLSWASEKGHEAVVKLLLERGADIESNDSSGMTPLSWAARTGHKSIIKLLLEKGADVMSKDGDGQTPLWWASVGEHDAIIKLLLEKGADNEPRESDDQAPLWWASNDVHQAIIELLHKRGTNIESKDSDGRTPLWWASDKGYEATVKLLLERGADVESKDKYDITPLECAVRSKYASVTSVLLDFGGTVTAGVTKAVAGNSDNGKELMALLLDRRGGEITVTEEVVKAAAGNYRNGKEVIMLLLGRRGVKITVTEQMTSTVAKTFDKEVMTMLLDRRGDKFTITEKVVKAAAGNKNNGSDVMALLLDQRGDDFTVTEGVVKAAAGNSGNGKEVMTLLLDRRGDEVTITEEIIKAAFSNEDDGQEVMALLLDRRGHEITITEGVVKAAAENCKHSKDVTALLLDRRGSEAAITEDVVKVAEVMPTRRVRFEFWCERGLGKFEYVHHFPSYLITADVQNAGGNNAYANLFLNALQSIIDEHEAECLSASTRFCGMCGRPSTKVLQTPMSWLHKTDDPYIALWVSALCERSNCELQTQRLVQTTMADLILEVPAPIALQ